MSRFRRVRRHPQLRSNAHPSTAVGQDRARRPFARLARLSVTLGVGLAILGGPASSLGAPMPVAATSVAGTTIDLQQERTSQAEVVRAALEAIARRLARERHEAWVARQVAKREAAYKALIVANRARYGATPDWDATADCESNGRWDINTGNGYWGGLQFSRGTWIGNSGGPFDGTGPFPYTKAEQIMVAEHVLASQGPHAWPVCFRWK